ncbi:MAG: class D sortase [Clostridia bacterium]|nr:class D sortase [Clostridia bacterium]
MKMNRRSDEINEYRRLSGRLLIIAGCLLMAAVLLVNVIDYVRSRTAVSQFAKEKEQMIVVSNENDQQKEQQISGQNEDIGETDTEDALTMQERLEKGELLGVLRISKIDLEEAVKEGSSSSVISSALGHMEETALPGTIGNCAIAGHRNYVFGRFFNRLNEVEAGDTVEIETLNGIYQYTVTESYVVEPEDVSVLSQDTKQSELTLITCTPLFVGSHRLIIKGTLQNETGR